MVDKLLKHHEGIKEERLIHAREHTVEVQLPFLQHLGKKAKIVPMLFGTPTVENCRILAEGIRKAAAGKSVFVLASTDMSHYPPYASAKKLDGRTLQTLRKLDVAALFAQLEKEERSGSTPGLRTAMCARGGVGTAMIFAKANGANHVQIIRYANSGDVPAGSRKGVVGYCSVLLTVKDQPEKPGP
jgi:AmmeMemoRadiSam system protein B